ncbi:MAG: DUF2798 domain-containing protein [Parcubacteria group bacterium]
MKKIPVKYSGILMGTLMGVFMSILMSGVTTFINLGLVEGFPGLWFRAFTFSIPVSFPIAFIMTAVVKRVVDSITERP